MSLPTSTIAAVPATLLIMGATVQAVAQASDAMQRDPDDVVNRLRKAEAVIGLALVAAAATSGNSGLLAVTALSVGVSYMLFDRLILR